ncbi:hypothetical protein [Corynebacterium cystitidis]|uniref:Uncharacterized protein n=1 Tax=Corynebacterium cystitidis DSM 20524 TaxID=1121357 RepID=A0A1H9UWY9_9CORY|nr:hypothetical protein [Corynebacterium cystitidis]WJY83682.1 hypothetical protein CCYS_14005 [Corynebacterium cystitidis DSM 20524]SES13567.1 hypothetical protein SAMN05661109_01954 [Corynebacterium cystitidis DSM 20524]SNV91339.1 Uncharacterised protein [Corynebacterium cystitidis]
MSLLSVDLPSPVKVIAPRRGRVAMVVAATVVTSFTIQPLGAAEPAGAATVKNAEHTAETSSTAEEASSTEDGSPADRFITALSLVIAVVGITGMSAALISAIVNAAASMAPPAIRVPDLPLP